jgi:hypothetical protein
MIVNRPQFLTGQTAIDIRRRLVHRQVLYNWRSFFVENLCTQIEERAVTVCRAFDPPPANVATSEMLAHRQQFSRG